MNKYESVIIINPNLEAESIKALIEKFSNLINNNGKVNSVEEVGKKKLAYEIKKHKEGYYIIILMGRLTRDPEVRYTQTNNTLVASFSLAVNRRFVRQGEERQADFINIVAWSKTGEFCSKYFKKGQQVGIIGRIQTRNWEDDQGQKHYVTEVVAEEAYFADSKRETDTSNLENTFGNSVSENSEFMTSSDDELPF